MAQFNICGNCGYEGERDDIEKGYFEYIYIGDRHNVDERSVGCVMYV